MNGVDNVWWQGQETMECFSFNTLGDCQLREEFRYIRVPWRKHASNFNLRRLDMSLLLLLAVVAVRLCAKSWSKPQAATRLDEGTVVQMCTFTRIRNALVVKVIAFLNCVHAQRKGYLVSNVSTRSNQRPASSPAFHANPEGRPQRPYISDQDRVHAPQ